MYDKRCYFLYCLWSENFQKTLRIFDDHQLYWWDDPHLSLEGTYFMNGPIEFFCFLEICRAGRFYNNSKSRCDLCPPETFSADDALTCAACPGSTTTYGKNAASQCHGGWIIKSIALSIECTKQIRKNLVMHILAHNLMVLFWMWIFHSFIQRKWMQCLYTMFFGKLQLNIVKERFNLENVSFNCVCITASQREFTEIF